MPHKCDNCQCSFGQETQGRKAWWVRDFRPLEICFHEDYAEHGLCLVIDPSGKDDWKSEWYAKREAVYDDINDAIQRANSYIDLEIARLKDILRKNKELIQ